MPYGAPELQGVARPYLVRALLVSSAFSTVLFAAFGLLRTFVGDAPVAPPPIVFMVDRASVPLPIGVVAPPAARGPGHAPACDCRHRPAGAR